VARWSFPTNHARALPRIARHPARSCASNIPVACNRDIADFMISSPLMGRHQGRDPAPGQARHNQAALRVARAG
jgi:methylglyoxal synthase